MKVTAFMCTFDDCEFLDATLESFKWFPDRLYIIEGSWLSAQQYNNTSARSGAEMYNILDKHVDNKRVFLIQANAQRERDQRQIGLERAKEDGADWCWMLDSDEVYPRKAIESIASILERTSNPLAFCYRLKSYNFINGFTRWYDGEYNRIFRPLPGAKFIMDNDVHPGAPLRYFPPIVLRQPDCRFYHYNYVKQNDVQFWRKMYYQNEQDPTFNTRMLPQYGSDGKGKYKIPDDLQIYTFTGKHPKIMQSHPYFRANIYNEQGIQFQDN